MKIESMDFLNKLNKHMNEQYEYIQEHEEIKEGQWHSYIEEGVIVVFYLWAKNKKTMDKTFNKFHSPFPGLIAPKKTNDNIAVIAQKGSMGAYDTNHIKNVYGFKVENGAAVIVSNHKQEMNYELIKGKSSKVNYNVSAALMYHPTESDSTDNIIRKMTSLLYKFNLKRLSYE